MRDLYFDKERQAYSVFSVLKTFSMPMMFGYGHDESARAERSGESNLHAEVFVESLLLDYIPSVSILVFVSLPVVLSASGLQRFVHGGQLRLLE